MLDYLGRFMDCRAMDQGHKCRREKVAQLRNVGDRSFTPPSLRLLSYEEGTWVVPFLLIASRRCSLTSWAFPGVPRGLWLLGLDSCKECAYQRSSMWRPRACGGGKRNTSYQYVSVLLDAGTTTFRPCLTRTPPRLGRVPISPCYPLREYLLHFPHCRRVAITIPDEIECR